MQIGKRKWTIAGGVAAFALAFSMTSAALPAPPPGGGWVVVDWVNNGVVTGRTVYGNCPPGSPQPVSWGERGGTARISYLACIGVE